MVKCLHIHNLAALIGPVPHPTHPTRDRGAVSPVPHPTHPTRDRGAVSPVPQTPHTLPGLLMACSIPTRSLLQSVESLDACKEADCSKPYVANLEASSQLEESSSFDNGGVVIDATPLPVRKRTRRGRLKAKEETEHKDENKEPVSIAHQGSFPQEVAMLLYVRMWITYPQLLE